MFMPGFQMMPNPLMAQLAMQAAIPGLMNGIAPQQAAALQQIQTLANMQQALVASQTKPGDTPQMMAPLSVISNPAATVPASAANMHQWLPNRPDSAHAGSSMMSEEPSKEEDDEPVEDAGHDEMNMDDTHDASMDFLHDDLEWPSHQTGGDRPSPLYLTSPQPSAASIAGTGAFGPSMPGVFRFS